MCSEELKVSYIAPVVRAREPAIFFLLRNFDVVLLFAAFLLFVFLAEDIFGEFFLILVFSVRTSGICRAM